MWKGKSEWDYKLTLSPQMVLRDQVRIVKAREERDFQVCDFLTFLRNSESGKKRLRPRLGTCSLKVEDLNLYGRGNVDERL